MLWEVEIVAKQHQGETLRVREEYNLLTHTSLGVDLIAGSARGYLLEGDLDEEQARTLVQQLLVDPLVEWSLLRPLHQGPPGRPSAIGHRPSAIGQSASGPTADSRQPTADSRPNRVTVLLKPGVMDPVAQSVVAAARDLSIPLAAVRTFRRYTLNLPVSAHAERATLLGKVLANEAIEQVVDGPLSLDHLSLGSAYRFQLVTVPLRDLDDAGLRRLSQEGQLALNLAELKAIQGHCWALGRDPTDVELETLAQTWSEHCSHKTLKGQIDFTGPDGVTRRIANLLQETIFGATQEIRRRLGANDWCVSVFEDNAGVVRFNEQYHVCFKVETHNHPSALEPYGGANTGLGGVIRDPLGTGLGAKPIANTDVFCFAPPDTPPEDLPPGVLHPRKVMKGVVAGVRDYGNRMGIPTVNGAVLFDDRYLGNPLVYCGTVGLIPVARCHKEAQTGDLIVTVGGRTGRDGIHGATFSSLELTSESEKVSGTAVQIGNAIAQKKLVDVILQARDRDLYHAITDCGAGGFSSAVGEMGANLGAVVHLDRAPLKYAGLSYTEIWISEAQERMVLAVPPDNWAAFQELCTSEDVEATVLGHFEASGRLRLHYHDQQVADLEMHFLHQGCPRVLRQAHWAPGARGEGRGARGEGRGARGQGSRDNPTDVLLKILGSYNVCSKEWIVRQYDHEVQGGTVIKPLVGVGDDGPGDAAVIVPVLGAWEGLALGCGINPRYGDLDPYWMAAAAIDEAVRNVVAVGADPARIALLDNFCWGNTDRPEVLGSLVRAAQACHDVALAFTMPFISGKDSLNNEFHGGTRHIIIPPTLLISALGRVPDVRRCVTMDLKEAGNYLYLVGVTRNELGGSHYHLVTGREGGEVPRVDLALAPRLFAQVHQASRRGLVRSCHDLSEGGLAAAVAEMAFAGGVGADLTHLPDAADDAVGLFAESCSRFVLEVTPAHLAALEQLFTGLPLLRIGQTCAEPRLRVAGRGGDPIVAVALAELKEAWQKPLRW